jgi:hypothetical protein
LIDHQWFQGRISLVDQEAFIMKTIISVLALAVLPGLALAQTSTETTTQTTAPAPAMVDPGAPAAPPVGTLSTTHEVHSVDAYGNRVDSQASTYRDSQGVASDRKTTVVTAPPPPPPPPTSTTTTTTTSSTSGPN